MSADLTIANKIIKSFLSINDAGYKDSDKILDYLESLEFIEMIMDLEEAYDIVIPDDEFDSTSTFEFLKETISKKVNDKVSRY